MKGGVFMLERFDAQTMRENLIRTLRGDRKEVGDRAHVCFEIDIMGNSRTATYAEQRACGRDHVTDGTARF